jgi:uncharacterized RDD family membrane protein YckC
MEGQGLEFAGFWNRVWASIIDTILVLLIVYPIVVWIYGWEYFDEEKPNLFMGPADFLITWVLPAVACILFWITRQATPGKMAFSMRIVDAATGGAPSLWQAIVRYIGYIVAFLPLGLGIFWVAFDRRKQGWHDKLAGTLVMRVVERAEPPVRTSRAEPQSRKIVQQWPS